MHQPRELKVQRQSPLLVAAAPAEALPTKRPRVLVPDCRTRLQSSGRRFVGQAFQPRMFRSSMQMTYTQSPVLLILREPTKNVVH